MWKEGEEENLQSSARCVHYNLQWGLVYGLDHPKGLIHGPRGPTLVALSSCNSCNSTTAKALAQIPLLRQ